MAAEANEAEDENILTNLKQIKINGTKSKSIPNRNSNPNPDPNANPNELLTHCPNRT
ncbi:unnamed protein product [Trichobilharzia regenti]|nr:unnamed protein product [Trichobilharzia regenti]